MITTRVNDASSHTDVVGFNPNRPYNAKPFDYVLVGVCVVVAIGMLVWAFAG